MTWFGCHTHSYTSPEAVENHVPGRPLSRKGPELALQRPLAARRDGGGGEPEAALPVDPAPVVAAVLDALPAFEADGSDDSERGGDDEFNDMCEVPASEAAEMMGWDTYDDDYAGS